MCKGSAGNRVKWERWGKGLFKKGSKGLPWWSSGQESACQCRGHKFDLWSGKIPHAARQLSPCVMSTEACALELMLHKRNHQNEKSKNRN